MCFIKNQAAFEKYLEFLVGRVQAESVMVSTAVQEFYKVTLCSPALPSVSWRLVGLPQRPELTLCAVGFVHTSLSTWGFCVLL